MSGRRKVRREREGEGRGAKWKNESHERKERRQAENCKAFSSTRFGPRTVSQLKNINAANDRVHPQTHTHTAPAIVDWALASLLLKSLKPRGIEEKTQLYVFFYSAVKLLPACRRLKEERWGDLCKKRKSKMYEVKDSVKADALRVKELREGEEGDAIERNWMLKE